MSTLSSNHIAQAIYEVSHDKNPSERETVLRNAVKFLAKKKLLSKFPQIITEIEKIGSRREEALNVRVASAEHLSDYHKQELAHALRERYGAKKVHWIEEIDPKILSGVRMQIGDEVIDLSWRNQLNQLQEYLVKE